jgi:hypothetical protein
MEKDNGLREQIVNIISNNCSRPGFDEYTRSADDILALFKPMESEEIENTITGMTFTQPVLSYNHDGKQVISRRIATIIALALSNKISGGGCPSCGEKLNKDGRCPMTINKDEVKSGGEKEKRLTPYKLPEGSWCNHCKQNECWCIERQNNGDWGKPEKLPQPQNNIEELKKECSCDKNYGFSRSIKGICSCLRCGLPIPKKPPEFEALNQKCSKCKLWHARLFARCPYCEMDKPKPNSEGIEKLHQASFSGLAHYNIVAKINELVERVNNVCR